MKFQSPTMRLAAAACGAAAVIATTSVSAFGHINVTPDTTDAGAYAVLTFSVAHGCDGSPTTKLIFDVPEPLVSVTPTVNPNWTVKKVVETLDEPMEGSQGASYSERVSQVVYTAKSPLLDGYRDIFELALLLPDTPGERLAVPVIQICEDGKTSWTQTYLEGQDEPDSPAPFITVTQPADTEQASATSTSTTSATGGESGAEAGSDILSWLGLGVGTVGLVIAAAAWRRSQSTP